MSQTLTKTAFHTEEPNDQVITWMFTFLFQKMNWPEESSFGQIVFWKSNVNIIVYIPFPKNELSRRIFFWPDHFLEIQCKHSCDVFCYAGPPQVTQPEAMLWDYGLKIKRRADPFVNHLLSPPSIGVKGIFSNRQKWQISVIDQETSEWPSRLWERHMLEHTYQGQNKTRAPQSGVNARLLCISWKRA